MEIQSMKSIRTVSMCLFFLYTGSRVNAQYVSDILTEQPVSFTDQRPLPQADSLVSIAHHLRLLPEDMGFFERNLWGENGLFRKTGIASPLTPEARKNELRLRRTMLVAHQVSGFVTLGLMLTTVYYGQKVIDGNYALKNTHIGFVDATIATYSLTGLLALLSPPPLIRRDEINTVSIHRALAWVHFTGMFVTPLLAATIHRRSTSYSDQIRIHQISGYVTTTAFAAAMVVMTF